MKTSQGLGLTNGDFTTAKHLGLPYLYRKVISKIRCSNHPLAIEIGRQKNPKTPREERICTVCEENAIEDEEHFLSKCPTYSILREHHRMNFEKFLTCLILMISTNFLNI